MKTADEGFRITLTSWDSTSYRRLRDWTRRSDQNRVIINNPMRIRRGKAAIRTNPMGVI
ncbi:MAG: hypothetical protein M1457_08270 [bacterium]|nr:hypothetical protein [bacterium]